MSSGGVEVSSSGTGVVGGVKFLSSDEREQRARRRFLRGPADSPSGVGESEII